jgi:large subunit ribosomal protein L24
MQPKLKVKKGDTVIILAGKDKGKRGTITRVIPTESRVVVEGVNIVKRHERPSKNNPQGGIVAIEAPLHVSNVALADPKDGKPTRVGFSVGADGSKQRVAKRSGEVIVA